MIKKFSILYVYDEYMYMCYFIYIIVVYLYGIVFVIYIHVKYKNIYMLFARVAV